MLAHRGAFSPLSNKFTLAFAGDYIKFPIDHPTNFQFISDNELFEPLLRMRTSFNELQRIYFDVFYLGCDFFYVKTFKYLLSFDSNQNK